MVYQFKNKYCPVCGKEITPYRYAMRDGVKYCLECEPLI